eukprot:1159449-Pelagomonas_calceolata.AAC.4
MAAVRHAVCMEKVSSSLFVCNGSYMDALKLVFGRLSMHASIRDWTHTNMSPSTILAKCRNNRDALAPYRLCWCICAQRASRHELRMEFPEGTNHSCMIFQASKQAIAWEKALSWENPDLRAASGMKVLGPHDVVTSFDGVGISNDGTVAFRSGERISFSYLISQVCVQMEAWSTA